MRKDDVSKGVRSSPFRGGDSYTLRDHGLGMDNCDGGNVSHGRTHPCSSCLPGKPHSNVHLERVHASHGSCEGSGNLQIEHCVAKCSELLAHGVVDLVLRGWINEHVAMGPVKSQSGVGFSGHSPLQLCNSVGLPHHGDPTFSIIPLGQKGVLSLPSADHQRGGSLSPSRLPALQSKGARKTHSFPLVSTQRS